MRSITHRLSNDYPAISHLIHLYIVLDDNISQIGIELACRKPMYKGHGENKNGKSNLFIGQLV